MIDIDIKNEQTLYTINLLRTTNFGQRKEFNGNYIQQLVGILAQTVVADLLNYKRPQKQDKPDGGIDYIINGKTIDLKTMGRKVSMKNHYVHNLIGNQIKYNTDILLFSSFNLKKYKLTICGYLPKKEFIKRSNFYPYGSIRTRDDKTNIKIKNSKGLFEIKNSLLYPINSIDQFKKEIC